MALVDALGCEESNASLLLDLCRTERKGAARDLAHRALARLSWSEGEAYLAEQAGQDPDKMLEILQGVSSETACRLTAQIGKALLDQMEAAPKAVLPQEIWTRLKRLCSVLDGKRGPEICAFYRRVAGLTAQQLDRQVAGEKGKPVLLRFSCFDTECQGSFRLLAALALCRTIMENGDAELCRLAMEFQAQGEEDFLAPALAARLIAQSPADSYDWAEKAAFANGAAGHKGAAGGHSSLPLCSGNLALGSGAGSVPVAGERGRHWSIGRRGGCSDTGYAVVFPAGPGRRRTDGVLLSLLDEWKVSDLPETVGRYLYQTALRSPNYTQAQRVVRVLTEQGWTQWDGFVVRWAQKNRSGRRLLLGTALLAGSAPGSARETTAQFRELERLIGEKKLKSRRYWPESEIQSI